MILWMNLMSRKFRSVAAAGALLVSLTGCASSPNGGPSTNLNAPNRLTVTMTLAQAVNSRYFYSFGFDDDDDASDGPIAIISTTDSANGVISGSTNPASANGSQGLTVLVRYQAGQFSVVRRTAQSNGNETLEEFPAAFIRQGNSPSASGNQITFTLDLDAVNGNGNFLFRHNSTTKGDLAFRYLDTNFVTTSEIRRGQNDNRIKPYDAFGLNTNGTTGNTYQRFDISSSRIGGSAYTQNDLFPQPEAAGDVFNSDGSLPDTTARGQLDISGFSIEVRRG